MFPSDDIKLAQELIVSLQRARKNLRIYPANNPIYSKTIEDTYKKIEEFLAQHGNLTLKIRQNEIMFEDKPVYQSSDKEDNLAFFFFKDGLREISLERGLSLEETRDFLQAVSFDFDKGDDEDVVTLLWEKDFEHIKYVVDENFLLEDESFESESTSRVLKEQTAEDDLKKAHEDAIREDAAEARAVEIMPVTNSDLAELLREIERDSEDKVPRLAGILFDLLYDSPSENMVEVTNLLNEAVEFTVRSGNMRSAVFILDMVKRAVEDISLPEMAKSELRRVFTHAASASIVNTLGELLDTGAIGDRALFEEYVQYLGKDAIANFIAILGELKTIEARKLVIDALSLLGEKDINALAAGLSDPRWYVVRNIIYIFRKIGDRRAVEFLIRAAHHSDVRVRMEVLRALGELGSQGVMQTLKDALDDPEASVRTTAARSLGKIKSEASKKIILNRLADKEFASLDFNEKKEYFEVLANWNDQDVIDFLTRTLKASSFFKKSSLDELKACAAFSLGLIGHKDSLAQLHKLRESKNRLLSEYAYAAIKRIEHGK